MTREEAIKWLEISIHAPRVGSDARTVSVQKIQKISIHAPRVGSDPGLAVPGLAQNHFNPRSPCGERLRALPFRWPMPFISIHAPRVGSDFLQPLAETGAKDFNPRSPCGERQTND